MFTVIDVAQWKRKNQFNFFKDYDNPFFNICTTIDVSALYAFSKADNRSFFIDSLYFSLKAANAIEEFRMRIKDDQVIVYDQIHAGSTVLNPDQTFSFCYYQYDSDGRIFHADAQRRIAQVLEHPGLDPKPDQDDLIHYSVIPWVEFTSVSNARRYSMPDSIPKIIFGKYHRVGDALRMPISVEVHHALVDGLHVGRYLEALQTLVNAPETSLGAG